MKRTKWATHKFTPDEKKARAKWRRAQENVNDLNDALRQYPTASLEAFVAKRAELHERLDKRLDVIEKTITSAKELFPEVDKSFTMATETIRL